MSQVLECPFCGTTPVITNVRMSNHSFKVGCYNEFCWRPGTDFYSTEKDAIEAWNKRDSALSARCLAAEAERDAAIARAKLLLDAKNYWLDRSATAEAERDQYKRESDALRWLSENWNGIEVGISDDEAFVEMLVYPPHANMPAKIVSFEGSTPLEAIENAMKAQQTMSE